MRFSIDCTIRNQNDTPAMKITRFLDAHSHLHLGLDRGDSTAEIVTGSIFDPASLQKTGRVEKIVTRLSPVDPPNIFCVGLNYREHAKESNSPIPQQPVIFMKPTTALNHPEHAIKIPACCTNGPEVDYECELAIVIGKPAKSASVENALEYVVGFTCANDVSARKWQRGNGGQWIRGKSFDTFCPLGPVLVTRDEIPNAQDLAISTTLNGQVMQNLRTSDMIFTVSQIVAFVSLDTTLQPGTVILTGTPQGVGFARTPPVFLKPGDEVVVEIEKIGKLRNTVEQGC